MKKRQSSITGGRVREKSVLRVWLRVVNSNFSITMTGPHKSARSLWKRFFGMDVMGFWVKVNPLRD